MVESQLWVSFPVLLEGWGGPGSFFGLTDLQIPLPRLSQGVKENDLAVSGICLLRPPPSLSSDLVIRGVHIVPVLLNLAFSSQHFIITVEFSLGREIWFVSFDVWRVQPAAATSYLTASRPPWWRHSFTNCIKQNPFRVWLAILRLLCCAYLPIWGFPVLRDIRSPPAFLLHPPVRMCNPHELCSCWSFAIPSY